MRTIVCGVAIAVGACIWMIGLWQLAVGNSIVGTSLIVGGGVVAATVFIMAQRKSGGVAEAIAELVGEFMHRS